MVPGSTSGSITDGTTLLTAALTAWSDPTGNATSIDPNLISSPNSIITARSTPGIDFNVTSVEWRFTSAEFFAGAPLVGIVQQATAIPEPSTTSVLAIAGLALACRRRSRRSK
ncbi:MAG: PEP-CTERM sorting domain-containing protein [Planctomycetota bacterium]